MVCTRSVWIEQMKKNWGLSSFRFEPQEMRKSNTCSSINPFPPSPSTLIVPYPRLHGIPLAITIITHLHELEDGVSI
ncbi:hypothetical protein QQP08_026937 [Theobroma cacao]|uniref:Uncharacterized protein n=1 Tax=Theobroma cacao TaxID=3641 RepID=A0A061GXM5_THECC|nr:Uncharacterized protein TCM_041908 [Theobroma cacao]WRX34450.1 hypothetical protein QQP08_026937 [Theobroma cacao]